MVELPSPSMKTAATSVANIVDVKHLSVVEAVFLQHLQELAIEEEEALKRAEQAKQAEQAEQAIQAENNAKEKERRRKIEEQAPETQLSVPATNIKRPRHALFTEMDARLVGSFLDTWTTYPDVARRRDHKSHYTRADDLLALFSLFCFCKHNNPRNRWSFRTVTRDKFAAILSNKFDIRKKERFGPDKTIAYNIKPRDAVKSLAIKIHFWWLGM